MAYGADRCNKIRQSGQLLRCPLFVFALHALHLAYNYTFEMSCTHTIKPNEKSRSFFDGGGCKDLQPPPCSEAIDCIRRPVGEFIFLPPYPICRTEKTICIMERGNEKCQPKNESTQRRRVTMRPSRRGAVRMVTEQGGPAGGGRGTRHLHRHAAQLAESGGRTIAGAS